MSQQSNDPTPGHSLHRRRHVARGVVLVRGLGVPWTPSAPPFSRRSRHLASSRGARGQRAGTSPAARAAAGDGPRAATADQKSIRLRGAARRRAAPRRRRMAARSREPAPLAAATSSRHWSWSASPNADGGWRGPFRGDHRDGQDLIMAEVGTVLLGQYTRHLDRHRRGGVERNLHRPFQAPVLLQRP